MVIPEWLFKEEQTPNKKNKKLDNPQTLKQIAREKIKMNDKEIVEELAEKTINP